MSPVNSPSPRASPISSLTSSLAMHSQHHANRLARAAGSSEAPSVPVLSACPYIFYTEFGEITAGFSVLRLRRLRTGRRRTVCPSSGFRTGFRANRRSNTRETPIALKVRKTRAYRAAVDDGPVRPVGDFRQNREKALTHHIHGVTLRTLQDVAYRAEPCRTVARCAPTSAYAAEPHRIGGPTACAAPTAKKTTIAS